MFFPLHDKNDLVHVRWQYVTIGLIIANILVFLLTKSGTAGLVLQHYALAFGLIPGTFTSGTFEQIVVNDPFLLAAPVSYAFLHADWMHLIGNMAFLWVFGDNIEDATGHFRYLLFYLLCAMGAALAHLLANVGSQIPLIGASGATSGIIAAYLLLHPNVKVWILVLGRIPLRISALYCLGAWLLFQIFNSLTTSDESVAWWAHLGGAATGALLIPFMKRRSVRLFDQIPGK